MKQTALIIGAGPAGLTAAYELLTKCDDITPVIIESENFVGGISRTAEYMGNRMDIGGHRFFSKDKEVVDLWTKLLPLQGSPSYDDKVLNREVKLSQGGPNPEESNRVMLIRSRVSRILFLRKFFDYPISLKFQTFANMGLIRTVKSGFGYLKSCIIKKDETSLENFYINRFGKPLYSMFFEDYTEKLWGVHPSEISADWGAQRVKGLSVKTAIKNAITRPFTKNSDKVETSLIESFYYPKFGPGQFYQVMADEIKKLGGEIRFNSTVEKINFSGDKINSVIVKCGDTTQEVKADIFLSSMAIKDLITAIGEEKSGKEVYSVATNLPYRDFITVGLLVDKLKVKNKTKLKTLSNIVPDCWIYVQEKDVKLGRIQIFNNWSPYMVKNPEETVWIGLEYFCTEGDELWKKEKDEFISFAIDELIKIGVIDGKENVLDGTMIKVKKAYPAYFGSYASFDKVKNFLDGIDNLYCIGRNGQHRYNNMDHSMATAMQAVKNIISGDKDKSNVWKVNTEKEYHEEK